MDWVVNNIHLTWKSAWILRTYKTCNSMVGFSKYELYNSVTLLRVIPGITWTQLCVCVCVLNRCS